MSSELTKDKLKLILTPDRLDIAIKVRFISSLLHGGDEQAVINYRLHIMQRTGGVEPRSTKKCVKDYINALHVLIESMQKKGFDARYPIRIDEFNHIRRGAHRLACGLVLGVVMFWAPSRPARHFRPWGRVQLADAGISAADIERAEREISAWKS
jgi:hypothetical protein